MTSSISVIIPAYNRAELIGETLRSLLNQTVPAMEIIVVDDGSTDCTAEAVEAEFAVFSRQFSGKGKLPELKVIRQDNAGPGAARNRGLAASTGEFIHFFDSDDIAALNKHEVQLRALQKSGADIAYGPWVKGRFAPAGARRVKSGELRVASEAVVTRYPLPVTPYARFEPAGPVLQARGLPEGDLVKALLTNWSIVPQACLFRRSILERGGGFPEDIWVGEDHLMFLRCLLAGAKVVHAPGTLTYYRVGSEGKLTSVGEAQKRHARDWARFLLNAESELAVGSVQMAKDGGRRSEVGGVSGSEPATRDSLPVTTTPSAWFGFRLRAYEAWQDLEKFFPTTEFDLKKNLEQLFLPNLKHRSSELLKYRLSGWWVRKVAGIKCLLTGSRARRCFCAGKYGPQEEALFCSAMQQVPR